MNKIKKLIIDLLLAPIMLLYQKVLDLEEALKGTTETITKLTGERDHLDEHCRMMSEDLAEAGQLRQMAESLTIDEQLLQRLSGKASDEEIIRLLRVGLNLARDQARVWREKHDKAMGAYQLALGSVRSMSEARDFQERRVRLLEETIRISFGETAKYLVPDEHTIEALQDAVEYIDETLVDGIAPSLGDYIDEDDLEAIRVHVSTLADWFNRHTNVSPTGPTEPPKVQHFVMTGAKIEIAGEEVGGFPAGKLNTRFAPSMQEIQRSAGFTPPTRPAVPNMLEIPRLGYFPGDEKLNEEACPDGGYCHHACKDGPCFRRDGCVPLTSSQLEDDWTPQPQLMDRLIERAMERFGAGVPRGMFSAANYAAAYREIVGTKRTLDGNECRRHLATRADVEKMVSGSHFRYTGNALRLPEAKLPMPDVQTAVSPEAIDEVLSVDRSHLPTYHPNPDACSLPLSLLDANDECPQCFAMACEHRNWIETERRRGRAQ